MSFNCTVCRKHYNGKPIKYPRYREKVYPVRMKAFFKRGRDEGGKTEKVWYDDPGGRGNEIAREEHCCTACNVFLCSTATGNTLYDSASNSDNDRPVAGDTSLLQLQLAFTHR